MQIKLNTLQDCVLYVDHRKKVHFSILFKVFNLQGDRCGEYRLTLSYFIDARMEIEILHSPCICKLFISPLEVIQQHSSELKRTDTRPLHSFKSLSRGSSWSFVKRPLLQHRKVEFFTLNYMFPSCPWWYYDCAPDDIVQVEIRVLSSAS